MTIASKPVEAMSTGVHDAIVDKLRACKTEQEILAFESWFNSEARSGPLYAVICDFLRNRSISRAVAAKWLGTLINDRENRLNN